MREWSFDRLRRYISLARCTLKPKLTPEAEALIRSYFQLRRQQEDDPKGRPTIRLIESLIRLTQAHARLMWMDEALPRDVIVAIRSNRIFYLTDHRLNQMRKIPKNTIDTKSGALLKKYPSAYEDNHVAFLGWNAIITTFCGTKSTQLDDEERSLSDRRSGQHNKC